MPRLTNARIIQAVQAARGLIGVAARQLGIDRAALCRRAEKSPAIAEAIADARALSIDVAELQLAEACKQGESWAIRFLLQTQGRDRGYAPRSDDAPQDEQLSEQELAELEQRLGISPPAWELPNH